MKKPTPETLLILQKIISKAGFPQNTHIIQVNLKAALLQIKDNLDKPYHLHHGTRPSRVGFGAPLPIGKRDESLLRNFITAELFRSWVLAYNKKPVINNKGYPATKFVVFAEQIFYLLGVGKVEDHLEEYQAYRAKNLKNK